ncbi:MAG: glycoside hydrolase family 3 protein [Clostridia bacterium]|nr:glycoside hydrolase family 3 protein [Clostridia bacterium]
MEIPAFSMELFQETARAAAAEGCVLLKNENGALPLQSSCRVAVFGRTQMNDFKSGLGSGGLVNARYVVGVYQALSEVCVTDAALRQTYEAWTKDHPFDVGDGWGSHPWYQQEMPLSDELVADCAARNDAAVVIIGRTAGEDRDNADAPGSWLLTQDEEAMLTTVCQHFPRTIVVLNVGNIIDMNWVERIGPAAVLYAWQGGQEHGNAVADVLSGKIAPCGRLTDTIARNVEDYPSAPGFGDPQRVAYAEDIYVGYRYFESFAKDKVLYPFGSGLSYTTFAHQPLSFDWDGEKAVIRHQVTNTGSVAAKEVVQAYARLPIGLLGQPDLRLCGFAKTGVLAPGESQVVEIAVDVERLASFDDSGATGNRNCYVLEAGDFAFFTGHDVRDNLPAGSFCLKQLRVLSKLEEACAPVEAFDRMHRNPDGSLTRQPVPTRTVDPAERRLERLPRELPAPSETGLTLRDVAEGRCTLEAFVAQMTDEDLCCIVRGEGMSSPRVTPGTAGAMGGVSTRLTDLFGLPTACCSDGPSGIRMDCGNKAFSMPNGTSQACSWNEELITRLYQLEGLEMRMYQVDALLGPGMNIHRHPLNGRNFEYFSEDPLVTGLMAVAQLSGLHSVGVTGTIKHYACNNQEFSRRLVDAVVSQRALREIYLKGFEIAVRQGKACSVMTTYCPLNGCWTASHYDLNTTILRGEWGFSGIVMTDWWAAGFEEGAEASPRLVASMVRAQNDLFMVTNNAETNSGGDDSMESLAQGKVTRAEYQRSAMNICRYLLTTPAFQRKIGQVTQLDRQLEKMRDEEGDVILNVTEVNVDAEALLDGASMDVAPGRTSLFQFKLAKRGQYRIDVTCRAAANLPDTAQVPLSVAMDHFQLGTQVLTGADKNWTTLSFTTREIRRRLICYVKFFFAVGGMEVRDVRVTRIQTFE